jgi:hypothetical protein
MTRRSPLIGVAALCCLLAFATSALQRTSPNPAAVVPNRASVVGSGTGGMRGLIRASRRLTRTAMLAPGSYP